MFRYYSFEICNKQFKHKKVSETQDDLLTNVSRYIFNGGTASKPGMPGYNTTWLHSL